jgi:hypothetical protein
MASPQPTQVVAAAEPAWLSLMRDAVELAQEQARAK